MLQQNETQGHVTPVNYKTLKILLEGYDRDKADMLERVLGMNLNLYLCTQKTIYPVLEIIFFCYLVFFMKVTV